MAERQRVAWYWPKEASPKTIRRKTKSIQFRAPAYTVDRREGCAVIRPTSWQSRVIDGGGNGQR